LVVRVNRVYYDEYKRRYVSNDNQRSRWYDEVQRKRSTEWCGKSEERNE
jgi:hypothetical protein